MSSTQPVTSTPTTTAEERRPQVLHLTFIVGPPAPREIRDQVAAEAARVRITPDELWVEMVRGVLAELEEASADGRSALDDLISDALEEEVTVWGVRGALHIQAGRQFPGMRIEPAQILDAAGRPVDRDFLDHGLRQRIGRALLRVVHADWLTCTAAYQPDELGFPSLAGADRC